MFCMYAERSLSVLPDFCVLVTEKIGLPLASSLCLYLALLYVLFTPHCPCHTLLSLYATGISTMVLSVKYQLIMGKSCLLDKAVCSRTVLTA